MRCIYLIPVQQEAVHKSPNDACARSRLGLLLHRRDLRLTPRKHRVSERNGPLLVQVVVGSMIVWKARNALDGVKEGAQARPIDRCRRAVPVLSERGVNR